MTGLTGITGGDGFIGRALLSECRARGIPVRSLVRTARADSDAVAIGNIGPNTDWSKALTGVDAVIHTAGRVHDMTDEATAGLLNALREVNVAGTLNLMRQAAAAGVRRFVFISSIKVNGEETTLGKPFRADDTPQPREAYGRSKHEAELALRSVAEQAAVELVIIRPVLVYGPGVKGNFLNLMNWVYRGVPMPLGSVKNVRSFVALDNVVDLVMCCLDHSLAANQTFLVSDGTDLSTPELIGHLGEALRRPARLFSVPPVLLQGAARFVGQYERARRLCGSLQVDIEKTRTLLEWRPPVTVEQGLRAMGESFLESIS